MSDDKPVLQVRGLKKNYSSGRFGFFSASNDVPAVAGIDFDLYGGETLGLVGESGCLLVTGNRSDPKYRWSFKTIMRL